MFGTRLLSLDFRSSSRNHSEEDCVITSGVTDRLLTEKRTCAEENDLKTRFIVFSKF